MHAIILRPIPYGWGVYLTDGSRLASFRGLCARKRAARYVMRVVRPGRGQL